MSDRSEVIDRAVGGGKPVAEPCAPAAPALSAATLLAHWRSLPHVDSVRLRLDLDELLDSDSLEIVR